MKILTNLIFIVFFVACGITPDDSINKTPDIPEETPTPEIEVIYCSGDALTETFAAGNGTEDNPYTICTVEQFYNIDNYSDKYFKLMADLDFGAEEFEELAVDNDFTGVFDGNNYTISNISYIKNSGTRMGIFNKGLSAKIENLTIEESSFISLVNYSGVIFGQCYNCVIENIKIKEVVLIGKTYTGLIAGEILTNSVASNIEISGESVIGTGTIGGAFGRVSYSSIENVKNNDVIINNELYDSIGGVVGECASCIMNNIENNSLVKGDERVGGVVGRITGSNNVLKKLINEGSVFGSDSVGGVVGNDNGNNLLIEKLRNLGNIQGGNVVGGVIGYSQKTNEYKYLQNEGSVSGNLGIGGLIGDAGITKLSYSFNKGAVSGVDDVGGLIGYSFDSGGSSFILSYSFNQGSVTGTGDYHGGLVGTLETDASYTEWDFDFVYNTGEIVTSSSESGAIVGNTLGTAPASHSCSSIVWSSESNNIDRIEAVSTGQITCSNIVDYSLVELEDYSNYIAESWDFVDESSNGEFDIWTMGMYPELYYDAFN